MVPEARSSVRNSRGGLATFEAFEWGPGLIWSLRFRGGCCVDGREAHASQYRRRRVSSSKSTLKLGLTSICVTLLCRSNEGVAINKWGAESELQREDEEAMQWGSTVCVWEADKDGRWWLGSSDG